ncbi:MAG TPA: putative Ig domain-containing protein [candidate division Zixibacteria bacterium]|nr:putative Ig domain-containing protein [candidate division Zixibacteria bacterium]
MLIAIIAVTVAFADTNPPNLKTVTNNNIPITHWADPGGSQPMTYADYRADHPASGSFSFNLITTAQPLSRIRDAVKFTIVINSDLLSQVTPAIDQYVMDLTGEGYEVEVYSSIGGNPEDLRAALYSRYQAGMAGCVFIGDLPVAWYETDFGDPPSHAEFPTDLFYMDLDGVYEDLDVDDIYDSHTGDVAPEIWMGRLTASPLTYYGNSEAELITRYFYKDHRYRSDCLPVNNRALVYVEDDWFDWSDSWDLDVGLAYNQRTFVKDKYVTFAPDYESRLDDNYELVEVCVHSWSGGHQFKNPIPQYSYTYFYELHNDIHPVGHFYNLFACSNALYTATDYMSGWYIFGPDYGLAAVGSSKSGSMLEFDDFYGPLGDGKVIGEAFYDWFAARAAGGFDESEITWHYGMTLNGDPTLKTQSLGSTDLLTYDNGAAYVLNLPGGDWTSYAMRFTAEEDITLGRVIALGSFPDSAAGIVYVYHSDGTNPTDVIDSVLVSGGDISSVDFSSRSISFSTGEEFHIAYKHQLANPTDSFQVYMDDGSGAEDRTSILDNGVWRRMTDIYSLPYNLCVHVEVITAPEPSIEITTDSLDDIDAGREVDIELLLEGGTPPFVWSLTAGALPDGLTLDSSSGKLSGTCSEMGHSYFSIRVDDNSSPSLYDVQHLDLIVLQPCGDVDGNGQGPDIADLVYLVTFMFQSGPEPPDMSLVDIDGSGTGPDIADLVYLVTYMFQSGPPPLCSR